MANAAERAKARGAWPESLSTLGHEVEAFGPADAQAAFFRIFAVAFMTMPYQQRPNLFFKECVALLRGATSGDREHHRHSQ